MTGLTSTPLIESLQALPRTERADALREQMESEFRSALLMTEDDELPTDESYFDLGLTSLSMSALRQRVEQQLGVTLDATVLFNEPTLNLFLQYLQRDPLAPLFLEPRPDGQAEPDGSDVMMQELLAELG